MPEETPKRDEAQEQGHAIDLSSLQNLALGPDWSSGSSQRAPSKADRYDAPAERHAERGPGGRRDRRGARPPRRFDDEQGQQDRPASRDRRDRDRGPRRELPPRPFEPTVEVVFYPDENAFKALTQAIKSSGRTFELFEIARLILDKPDRFIVQVRPLPSSPDQQLYISVPDGLPFETEQEAIEHVFTTHLETLFEIEEVEVDPPKGVFNVISKCGFTGELLGPPNYHRYQQLLQQHHARNLPKVTYERFLSRLESVRDPESVTAWTEKMRKQTRLKLKEPHANLPAEFDNPESARFQLTLHAKDSIVKAQPNARFDGKLIEKLPAHGSIRKSVESVLDYQRRFPLDTANNIRGRLRRLNFSVYKKGSKGISYVCAVKRQFRVPGQTFSENLQQLIDFIEEHQDYPAVKLPKDYLGVEIPEGGEQTLPEEDQTRLKQLRTDLRWLVTSGYVTEYSDGRLYAPAPRITGANNPDDDADEPSKPSRKKGGKQPAVAEKSTPTPEAEPPQHATDGDEPVAPEQTDAPEEKGAPEVEDTPASDDSADMTQSDIESREFPQVHATEASDKDTPEAKAVAAQNGEVEPVAGDSAPDEDTPGLKDEPTPEDHNEQERDPNDPPNKTLEDDSPNKV